jgi:hypothetical protein
MSDDHHSGFLLFNQGGDVLEAVLQHSRGRARCGVLSLGSGGSSGFKTLHLGFLGLRLVLDQQLEQLSGLVLVESGGELLDGRGDLQALEQDLWETGGGGE